MSSASMPIYAPTETNFGAPLFSEMHSHATTAVAAHHQQHLPYAAAAAANQRSSSSYYAKNSHNAATASAVSTMGATSSAMLIQQQQQMFMMMQMQQQSQQSNVIGSSSHTAHHQQQQMPLMLNPMLMMMPQQQMNSSHVMTAVPSPIASSSAAKAAQTQQGGRAASRSPLSPTGMMTGTTTTNTRAPSTPFNPAAAMPLEDMIVAYNTVKSREIERQAAYAAEVAAAAGSQPPAVFVSPFVEYACSQQGKLVLQGLLHFEEEVAVALDLYTSIGSHIETIALNEHGCHVIRALGEKIGNAAPTVENEDGTINAAASAAANEAALQQFVHSLHETLFLNICTLSQESRRIPQALFETYNAAKPELFAPLVDIVARNVLYLSATQQGCIAFMRMFEASNYEQKRHMANNLIRIVADLSCDSFGNYVVQCLVEHSEVHVAAQYVTAAFSGQCVRLACNKFASNVMEKVVRRLSHIPSVRRLIVDELVFDPTNATVCCEDSYANFVVQTVIETSVNQAEFRKLYDRVKAAITNSMYAAKIEARLRAKGFLAGGGSSHANAPNNSGTTNNSNGKQQHSSQHNFATPFVDHQTAPVVVAIQQQHTAPISSSSVSVTVGGVPQHQHKHHSENSPVMQAMMAAAAAAAQQHNSHNNTLSSANTSGTNNSSTAPIYHASTQPSTPMAATAAGAPSNNTNGNNKYNNNKRSYNGASNNNGSALPVDAAIVSSSPKRSMNNHTNGNEAVVAKQPFSPKNGSSRRNHNNANEHSQAEGKSNYYNNKPSAAATTTAKHNNTNNNAAVAATAAVDPLQVEAKRLMNSDQPPSTFTPYKPSPFQDRGANRQNIQNNNNNGVVSNAGGKMMMKGGDNAHYNNSSSKPFATTNNNKRQFAAANKAAGEAAADSNTQSPANSTSPRHRASGNNNTRRSHQQQRV